MTFLAGPASRLKMKPDEFRLLRDLINEHAGLHFGDDSMFVFERRLAERVVTLGLDGFDAYYKHLRFAVGGPTELEQALGSLGPIPAASDLRGTEPGLVMLRGRMGGDGNAFNLGEAPRRARECTTPTSPLPPARIRLGSAPAPMPDDTPAPSRAWLRRAHFVARLGQVRADFAVDAAVLRHRGLRGQRQRSDQTQRHQCTAEIGVAHVRSPLHGQGRVPVTASRTATAAQNAQLPSPLALPQSSTSDWSIVA